MGFGGLFWLGFFLAFLGFGWVFCGLFVLFLQDFQNKQRKIVIRKGLCPKMVPYTVLKPVVFQLLHRTGESHLPLKGADGICFYSALRDEILRKRFVLLLLL